MEGWKKLPVSLKELCINTTLRCGQSFRWRKSEEGEWSVALHGRILSLKQDPEFLHYRAIFPTHSLPTPPSSRLSTTSSIEDEEEDTLELIKHYFNLTPNLTQLYEEWASADANFRKRAPKFTGVRILQQDAWEALVGFICSSNNNIARISQMVEKLCLHFGPLVGHIDTKPFHDFPSPKALTGDDVEAKLRDLGFGYRAKYLWKTAKEVDKRGLDWLESLRNPEKPVIGKKAKSAGPLVEGGRKGYRHAQEQLLELQGVGPKVADCVCLFGLGWGDAVPVDTHVWQIAQRDYKFGKGKHASLTKATYDAIGNKFRDMWGKEAGWAHSVLFTADLRAFSERLVAKEEVETTEVVVKEEGSDVVEEITRKKTKVMDKRVKREAEDGEEQVLVLETTVKREAKRRRRS